MSNNKEKEKKKERKKEKERKKRVAYKKQEAYRTRNDIIRVTTTCELPKNWSTPLLLFDALRIKVAFFQFRCRCNFDGRKKIIKSKILRAEEKKSL